MTKRALIGAAIFDGKVLHQGRTLLLDGPDFVDIVADDILPPDYPAEAVDGGIIMPGFVDLQVNGGGGVMFNDATNVAGLTKIAAALVATGTRAFLPTLITDTPERTRAAIDAVESAIAQGVPGVIGLHLEGPHLSVARKGAHDPSLIRPMTDEDEALLLDAARRLPNVLVTVAPESVTPEQIGRLSDAGLIVSLGHSDCSFEDAQTAFAAGARCVTHLFNAMSQMSNRAPGLVGAALDTPGIAAGLIADDIHVHASMMRIALAAKQHPGKIFLVTDAMATAGSEITQFTLNGRTVLRRDGRLTLEDGTLAGADLNFSQAISVLVDKVGVAPETALAMATQFPADCLKQPGAAGAFVTGHPANAIRLGPDFAYLGPC
ncbi:N-acetylglucosamine-6-phosphate deacetylase [Yoonia sp. F2084L]|uniref:N-acetylglucosamine-6-phosphate deacetylase n=1 Tax=Yoonia sp. F2084L TaxID=2926419 RepID=UPI001FF14FCD|nr:N-acetylglucosamine-6-phosphate deacetylase [Yoonia sp. F2084L]MCK0097393.1 N-acetylglucosamine-6-phosphate deacetylase [Yoonia sp. F2084L]